MRGVFITGTDTGVGKTWIGAALAWLLSQRGVSVRPRKPVESGCFDGDDGLMPQDGLSYYAAVGGTESLARICPFRFQAALSPARAAMLQGVDICLRDAVAACYGGVQDGEFLLVEGAGGFCSPLTVDGLNADLAMALDLPVLLVTANRLGAIHQTLVTAEAIVRRGLTLAGVVLNETEQIQDPRMDNAADLSNWLREEVIVVRRCAVQQDSAWREIAPFLTAMGERLAGNTGFVTGG